MRNEIQVVLGAAQHLVRQLARLQHNDAPSVPAFARLFKQLVSLLVRQLLAVCISVSLEALLLDRTKVAPIHHRTQHWATPCLVDSQRVRPLTAHLLQRLGRHLVGVRLGFHGVDACAEPACLVRKGQRQSMRDKASPRAGAAISRGSQVPVLAAPEASLTKSQTR